MKSHSVELHPYDSECRYWAKIIRANEALPIPSAVQGADDIPGRYLRGEEELLPGDVLFEGEDVARTGYSCWVYWVSLALDNGDLLVLRSEFGAQKAQMKRQGMEPELLKGSGDVAGMVRIAHGVRNGLMVTEGDEP